MSDPYENTPERTFAALPPASGRGFAQTWWGQAWLKALEDTALDSGQVKTGRRLARAGAVGAVSVRPGRITAVVQDRDRTAHRADVLLQELSEEQWDHFLGVAVERAGHIAALLDREMPPHLVEDAAATGVELLPGLGDLEAECDCGAWDHCGHTAALCYQVARLLDQDPFVLLLMRGRGERELLDELQVRSVPRAETEAPGQERAYEGVDATEAYADGEILPPLPDAPPVPAEPGLPPSLDTETDPAAGVDPAALEFLATQAAHEAHRLLAKALRPGHEQRSIGAELTLAQDAVRLASGAPEASVAVRLAEGSGRDHEGLALAVRAWELGGVPALDMLEPEADRPVEAETLARARAALESGWEEDLRPSLHASGNHWTVVGGRTQLRLGADGRWWPYRKERGRWAPTGPASQDPATALALAEGQE
ncbi:SWF or SNF family helicase [Streptomyces sp. NBC_00878]|uniref:SWIM zinc finger family protein n=1 Tax=Streptomyces sp. NBC_00878 TaxID=2975854 RepID=UPI002252C63B|nr:SWF or SNF family helicase [Streptomyces sp. NBC_00878]MCX4910804.1 SWF or SNF family helicase [Streptomyces sp. NBC_00878]